MIPFPHYSALSPHTPNPNTFLGIKLRSWGNKKSNSGSKKKIWVGWKVIWTWSYESCGNWKTAAAEHWHYLLRAHKGSVPFQWWKLHRPNHLVWADTSGLQLDAISANTLFSSTPPPHPTPIPITHKYPTVGTMWRGHTACMIQKLILIKSSATKVSESELSFLFVSPSDWDWPQGEYHQECSQTFWRMHCIQRCHLQTSRRLTERGLAGPLAFCCVMQPGGQVLAGLWSPSYWTRISTQPGMLTTVWNTCH